MLFLGIDGGGTKTTFCLCDSSGSVLAKLQTASLDYHETGFDGYAARLQKGVSDILSQAGISAERLYCITVGTPCFGESEEDSRELERLARGVLPATAKTYVVNDVLCAMYGALAGKPGICILSGTGSMAMGMDETGRVVRAGGWSHLCSDVGSGYWLGRQAMFLFAKQAEWVVEQGALYRIIMEKYSLARPMDIIPIIETAMKSREQVAAFQMLLYEAACAGDVYAASLFPQAAEELALLAGSVRKRLFHHSSDVKVSYAGGLFNVGELLIEPLRDALAAQNLSLAEPVLGPAEGAALHALKNAGIIIGDKIITALKRQVGHHS